MDEYYMDRSCHFEPNRSHSCAILSVNPHTNICGRLSKESRHGSGFWQDGMQHLSDEEFMAKVVAGGRAFALKMVGKAWRVYWTHWQ